MSIHNDLAKALQDLIDSQETHRPKALWDNARAAVAAAKEERATREEISAARNVCGDAQIDGDAEASRGEGGYWVSAWVWVGDEEAGE